MLLHTVTRVPVSDPGGHVVGDVSGVYVPVSGGQLFDLEGEIPQGGRARATCHPVEADTARFNAVLGNGQLPGWLGPLCGEKGRGRAWGLGSKGREELKLKHI